MVKLFFVFLGATISAQVFAITADELRALSNEKERAEIQRKGRAKSNALGDLISPSPSSSKYGAKNSTPDVPAVLPPAAPSATVSDKGEAAPAPIQVVPAIRLDGQPVTPNPRAVVPAHGRGPRVAERGEGGVYVPPASPQSSTASSDAPAGMSDAVPPSTTFGIRLGSWLVAALQRNTTSAESGTVELLITEAYVGDRRTLPAGTMVFAEKVLNTGTKRMELSIKRGITPSGVEFQMEGLVFDPQKTTGLAGVFVLDKKRVATTGFVKGTLAAIGAVSGTLGTGAQGQAARVATQSVLSDTEQASEFNNGQQAIIYVSPQKLLIRVEKQF